MHPIDYLGFGEYVGEIREGPDGQLYQWNEGVDGLGQPIGFWKAIRAVGKAVGRGLRAVRRVTRLPGVRHLLPVAAGAVLGPAGAVGVRAAQSAGLLGEGVDDPGVGSYVGEIRQGPDGQLYQWHEGVDGLGQPIGFWKAIRSVGKAVGQGLRAARRVTRLPLVQKYLPTAAGAVFGPGAARGVRAAQRAGLLGW